MPGRATARNACSRPQSSARPTARRPWLLFTGWTASAPRSGLRRAHGAGTQIIFLRRYSGTVLGSPRFAVHHSSGRLAKPRRSGARAGGCVGVAPRGMGNWLIAWLTGSENTTTALCSTSAEGRRRCYEIVPGAGGGSAHWVWMTVRSVASGPPVAVARSESGGFSDFATVGQPRPTAFKLTCN